jgi:hypothetical protein
MCAWVQKILRFSQGGFLPPFAQLQPLTSNPASLTPTGPLSGIPVPSSHAPRRQAEVGTFANNMTAQDPPVFNVQRTLPFLRTPP